ncbi:MAG: XRE family transcriptional regulator [Prosthecobacter sp.]|uniref:helix-turn-helix domain-containing protein n=1 Tax=Prosthecobacter sp. TaxID=1965333 RepID=UPI003BB0C969
MSERNITQVILAQTVGVTQGAVSGWLNGGIPKMDKLIKIAETLQVPPEDLMFPGRARSPVTDGVAIAKIVGGTPELQRAIVNASAQVLNDRVLREDVTPYVTGARATLKSAREAKGISQAELAKAIGYKDPSTYINIEEGRSQMGEKMIKKAAKILGLDESDLMSSEHPVDRNPDKGTFGAIPEINLPPGMTAKYVPLLSLAQCGPNMTWTDDGYTGDGVLAIDCKDPKAFAVKLSGDSMSPKYDPGDTAIIYPSFTPRNGDLVLARLHDEYGGDVMIKLYQSSADSVTLSSYNPVYQPTSFPREAFAILYPVIQITKKLR